MPNDSRCLLSGTLVYTPKGWIQIDYLTTDDYVINQSGEKIKILLIGKWPVYWNSRRFCDRIYKIPRGLYGCTQDTYISSYHKIEHGGMIEVFKLGLELAKQEELTDMGRYILYHIQLENDNVNNFIVNGGCVVESWHGATW